MTNVRKTDGSQIGSTIKTLVIEHEGVKIGLIGIAEQEWIATLGCFDADELEYQDFVEATQEFAYELREKEKCDFIIALTHMRIPNDNLLCKMSLGVD